jgi:hypothetical protein
MSVPKHEIGLLRFLKPPVRVRLRDDFEKNGPEALRNGLRSLDLWHARDFDPRYMSSLPQPWSPQHAHELLRRAGAPGRCWTLMLSDHDELTDPNMDLAAALDLAFDGRRAVVLSCIPGELAYVDGDFDRYILRRHPVS